MMILEANPSTKIKIEQDNESEFMKEIPSFNFEGFYSSLLQKMVP